MAEPRYSGEESIFNEWDVLVHKFYIRTFLSPSMPLVLELFTANPGMDDNVGIECCICGKYGLVGPRNAVCETCDSDNQKWKLNFWNGRRSIFTQYVPMTFLEDPIISSIPMKMHHPHHPTWIRGTQKILSMMNMIVMSSKGPCYFSPCETSQ